MATKSVNITKKSRSHTVHGAGTEYIVMDDSQYGGGSITKPPLSHLGSNKDKEVGFRYPGEEDLHSPHRTSHPSLPVGRPPTSDGPKKSSVKHTPADDEIVIQTEITVSIANKDSIREDSMRPWEIVAGKPGRAV